MVYSTGVVPVTEDLAEQISLALQLIFKLKREYYEICGFVRERMSLAIVISNSLLLQGLLDK